MRTLLQRQNRNRNRRTTRARPEAGARAVGRPFPGPARSPFSQLQWRRRRRRRRRRISRRSPLARPAREAAAAAVEGRGMWAGSGLRPPVTVSKSRIGGGEYRKGISGANTERERRE